jgi:hypothetical protein
MRSSGGISRRQWLRLPLAIVVIIAIIAIPNVKLARMTANEAAAQWSSRAINVAQAKFSTLTPEK